MFVFGLTEITRVYSLATRPNMANQDLPIVICCSVQLATQDLLSQSLSGGLPKAHHYLLYTFLSLHLPLLYFICIRYSNKTAFLSISDCIFSHSIPQSPPTTPITSPATSSSAYQDQARRFYGSDRAPMSLKSAPPLSPGRRSDPSSSLSSRSRNQDNYSNSDSRRLHNPGSSSLLSTWNGGGSSTSVDGSNNFLLSLPPPSSSSRTPSSGGAASMPSSPRLGRRSFGNPEPLPSSRTRKYSAGSLSGMVGGGHSRSLPRLCPSQSPRDNNNGVLTLSTLPPRRSDVAGGYKFSKDHYNNSQNANSDLNHNSSNSSQLSSNRNQIQTTNPGESVVSISLSSPKNLPSTTPSITSTTAPPDVTIPSRTGGSSSPRVAKKLSLTSTNSVGSIGSTSSSPPELERLASRGVSPGVGLSLGDRERRGVGLELTGGFGERRSSFGKAGLEPGIGLGERRQSFGKAGVTPPGGFRERRGSISSLSGKEELTDYHQHQKEERLREQEVERLVSLSVFAHVALSV